MKKLALLIVCASVAVAGCDSVLEQTNPNQLAEENFWQSEGDAHLALMGAYSALQSPWLFDSSPWGGGVMRLSYISDDGYTRWQWVPLAPLARGEFGATSWGNDAFYSAAYDVIRRANQVIARVPEIESMDPAVAERMRAEAKVLRATAYLQLAMTYADVPLIETPLAPSESNVPKSDSEEIYDFIFTNLREATESLPLTVPGSEWGRLTKGAALGMLARAYLYHGEYADAASAAQEVMDLDVYSLYPDYDGLFSAENEVNDEVILPVTFERGQGGEGANFAGYWGNAPMPYHIALPDLAEAYYCKDGLPVAESPQCSSVQASESRDPRFSATLLAKGDMWKGEPATEIDVFYQRKWTEEENDLNHFDSPQDFYVLRYAHILLIRAEALAQTSTSSEVYELINQLRDRVGMPHIEEVEGSDLSQQALLDVVKHERRVETAFEGLRYYDIKRWGQIEEAYEEYNKTAYNQYGPNMRERKWEDKYMKWPLPQAAISRNDQLEQHEGY